MKIEYSTAVQSSVERVWEVFTHTENWPTWSKLVKQASWIEGPAWTAGSKFLIELSQPQFKLKAEAAEVSSPHAFSWKGNVMGIAIAHHLQFDSQPDGSTLVKSWIELSGPAVFFINEEMKKKGLAMFGEFMAGLKLQAETR
jgi:uncharacterized membrane protein